MLPCRIQLWLETDTCHGTACLPITGNNLLLGCRRVPRKGESIKARVVSTKTALAAPAGSGRRVLTNSEDGCQTADDVASGITKKALISEAVEIDELACLGGVLSVLITKNEMDKESEPDYANRVQGTVLDHASSHISL